MDSELKALINKIGNSAVVVDGKPPAAPTCRHCNAVIDGEPKLVEPSYGGPLVPFHPACWASYCEERNKARAEANQREIERKVADLKKRFDYYMSGHAPGDQGHGIGHPPNWPYARFDNEVFRARSSKKIVSAVERWDPKTLPTLLLCAPTGRGKTSALVAWLWRHLDQQAARVRAGEEKVWIAQFVFATGPELAVARRNAALGEEAPLVKHALDCKLLILDELGFEKASEAASGVPFEIVDHRYRQQAVTVVTTGLRPTEFRAKYGDAMYRRLTEGGAVVEDFTSG